ncbi:MAG: DUF948 domain-containing protein [Bacillus sp. (in: firmicutes)]
MEIILYLSAAVAAVAFLILVIYLVKTLKSLQVTLDSVSHTLTGLEKQLQGLTTESTLLLHKTNALAEDLQEKSENLNTVVDAVKEVGTTVKSFNTSLQSVSARVENGLVENQDKIAQVVQWGNAFFQLRDNWKKRSAGKGEVVGDVYPDKVKSPRKTNLRSRG